MTVTQANCDHYAKLIETGLGNIRVAEHQFAFLTSTVGRKVYFGTKLPYVACANGFALLGAFRGSVTEAIAALESRANNFQTLANLTETPVDLVIWVNHMHLNNNIEAYQIVQMLQDGDYFRMSIM
ncbi:MAG TPA: hypothetical protein VEA59_05560 [Patescibacteria group bacterium]|nr:hypothetical protein [Patescibacteria group bacterium]